MKAIKITLMLLLIASVFPTLQAKATTGSIDEFALNFEGTPYKFAGNTPEEGFDCSGFIVYVFNHFNIKLPRTSEGQFDHGTPIEAADLQPGDLVFFKDTYKQGISHTGIYLGDNQFISAENEKRGVAKAKLFGHPYWEQRYIGAKRPTDTNANPSPTIPVIQEKSFVDVDAKHPAYNAILDLSSSGIINGFPNDEFKPEETITRGQAAAMLNRVLKLTPMNDEIVFNDVDKNHQFAVHIAAMNEADILRGYENGNFGLNDNLTRTQLAVIVDRAFNLQEKAKGQVHISSLYNDIPSTYWAMNSINALKQLDKTGVFQTPTYEFTKIVTRAEFAAAVYSAVNTN
ncbi:S-layer homology domain-containing protein [Sporosarcina thermotolerans]|uniref:S-layer homology domain-containing protein n=1 Tax=Sporosarcina thermotolerans TaxID=633404 RepID=A0AAW9A8X0_9BACL|nr:NlpC/P60 family protein [Sporosarcina thermotolerans]MDW0116335.1 S-layer homology domain-containing protein [Sporosarcina thermotolerans]WHT48301.1 S-layer homology domain-containing protein [Sporosarcina thermotolerans]